VCVLCVPCCLPACPQWMADHVDLILVFFDPIGEAWGWGYCVYSLPSLDPTAEVGTCTTHHLWSHQVKSSRTPALTGVD
jgi:hypothetical protein